MTATGPFQFMRDIELGNLPDTARLMIHAQNPAANHYWTKTVGVVTAGEVRAAVRSLTTADGEGLSGEEAAGPSSLRPAPSEPPSDPSLIPVLVEALEGFPERCGETVEAFERNAFAWWFKVGLPALRLARGEG